MEKDETIIAEILVAAKSLFAKFGLKKTTIEDISAAAGKGKSTLYHYFPGKNEIFVAVVKYEMKTVIRNLGETVLMVKPAKAKLKAFLTTQSTAIQELQSLNAALFEDIIECRKMLMPLRLKYEQMQMEMIAEIITKGIEKGEFRLMPDEHVRKLSLILIIAFRGLQFPLSINPAAIQAHEYIDVLVDMLVDGIGN